MTAAAPSTRFTALTLPTRPQPQTALARSPSEPVSAGGPTTEGEPDAVAVAARRLRARDPGPLRRREPARERAAEDGAGGLEPGAAERVRAPPRRDPGSRQAARGDLRPRRNHQGRDVQGDEGPDCRGRGDHLRAGRSD